MEETVWYCKDKEHVKHLMQKLEERGWMWSNGKKPTELKISIFTGKNGLVVIGRHNRKTLYWDQGNNKGKYTNVIHVKLPSKKEEPAAPAGDAIRPEHYRNGKMDRFEMWYLTYPFNEFRTAMKCVVDRYVSRYDRKDGTKDIKKAIETLERLMEYEEREGNA